MGWDQLISQVFLVTFFAATIRMATPILLAALGEIFTQRSGVLNLGLEGIMTISAFTCFITIYYSGNVGVGILSGIIIGGLVGLLHAFFSVSIRANQVVTGLAITLLAPGITGFFLRAIFGVKLVPPIVGGLGSTNIPVLSQIPIIGPILFQQNILVYITIILVPIFAVLLYKTRFGLRTRAVGENPHVADAMGINPYKIRYICVIFGGIMAGLAGSYLMTYGVGGTFLDHMVAGRGWVAIAVVIFSRWSPYKAFAGALIFAGGDAFQLRLQALGIQAPYPLFLMMPYALTLIAFVMLSRGGGGPSALTVPYKRD